MEQTKNSPVAKAEMLIHGPISDIYNSFIDPHLLTKFWLAKSSGPLELGKSVIWDFMVPGASAKTKALVLERDSKILILWDDETTVDISFKTLDKNKTVVKVQNQGFKNNGQDAVAQAIEATQGFTIVLCDLKTFIEQGCSMNIVRDKAFLIENGH